MSGDWFHQLFGFAEASGPAERYAAVKAKLAVDGTTLTSKVNHQRYQIGTFATPSLGELRARVAAAGLRAKHAGRLRLSVVVGDVSELQASPQNRHATFQAASQFNCLEFMGPTVTPEAGVTGYVRDRTQGPACSIGAGPATVYRNYFAPVQIGGGDSGGGGGGGGGDAAAAAGEPQVQYGQTQQHQINNLADVSALLGNTRQHPMFRVQGGYTLAKDAGLKALNAALAAHAEAHGGSLDAVHAALRVGVHADVQVTSARWGTQRVGAKKTKKKGKGKGKAASAAAAGAGAGGADAMDVDESAAAEEPPEQPPEQPPRDLQLITQVFGSACACAYSRNPRALWAPFARLVLAASYEATLLAALEASERHGGAGGSRVVYLTLLGGGVFGNSLAWIVDAIRGACASLRGVALDVRVVSYSPSVDKRVAALVAEFASGES